MADRGNVVAKVLVHVDHIERLLELIDDARSRDDPHVNAALSLYTSNLYSEIEHILKLLVRDAGLEMPASDAWHKQLIEWFVPGNDRSLPALIEPQIKPTIDELRRYRHVARVHSAITLDHSKVLMLLPGVLEATRTFLASIRAEIERRNP